LSIDWPGVLPAPSLDGDTATYVEALPGVDVKVTASSTGYSYVMVVKSAEAAEDLAAELKLPVQGQGLAMRKTASGGLSMVDGQGEVIFEGAQPNLGTNAPRFVTEYTSPNGNRYYGRTTSGGVDIESGSVLDDVLRGRHTGCSEVCALNEAQKAGDEIFGGTFRTLKTNSGQAVDPCKDFCQPMINRIFGTW